MVVRPWERHRPQRTKDRSSSKQLAQRSSMLLPAYDSLRRPQPSKAEATAQHIDSSHAASRRAPKVAHSFADAGTARLSLREMRCAFVLLVCALGLAVVLVRPVLLPVVVTRSLNLRLRFSRGTGFSSLQ